MDEANTIVNRILHESAEDAPEPYVDWLKAKTEKDEQDAALREQELADIAFGFAVRLTDEELMRANAAEGGINIEDVAVGDQISRDYSQLERNTLRLMRACGFNAQDHGHDGHGDLVGSCWVTGADACAALKRLIDGPGDWPSTSSGTFNSTFPGSDTALWVNVSDIGQRLLDVTVDFFDLDAFKERLEAPPVTESADEDDNVDVTNYIHDTFKWLDVFVEAGMTRDADDVYHADQWWKRYSTMNGDWGANEEPEPDPNEFLPESTGEDDPAINVARHMDGTLAAKVKSTIDSATRDFYKECEQHMRRKDLIACDMGYKWNRIAGFDETTAEAKAVRDALYKTAGYEFPNWRTTNETADLIRGIDLVKRLLQIGTAQGGFLNFTLKEIRQRDFRMDTVDIRELMKTDHDFHGYAENYSPRSYEDGGLKPTDGSDIELEPQDLYGEPIVVIDGCVRDGWSRAAAHFKAGEFMVQAWVALPPVLKESDDYVDVHHYVDQVKPFPGTPMEFETLLRTDDVLRHYLAGGSDSYVDIYGNQFTADGNLNNSAAHNYAFKFTVSFNEYEQSCENRDTEDTLSAGGGAYSYSAEGNGWSDSEEEIPAAALTAITCDLNTFLDRFKQVVGFDLRPKLLPNMQNLPAGALRESSIWSGVVQSLVDSGRLSARAAERYSAAATEESDSALTTFVTELDEQPGGAETEELIQKAVRTIQITTMRYGSALRDATKGVDLTGIDESAGEDEVDPKAYALSMNIFNPHSIVEKMEQAGWKYVGCQLAFPDTGVWLLGWTSPLDLTYDMPETEYEAEVARARAAGMTAVKAESEYARQFEWYAPGGDSDFLLYFRIPSNQRPTATRTWESVADPDDVDPKEYAMALPVFDPKQLALSVEAAGWADARCYKDGDAYKLGFDNPNPNIRYAEDEFYAPESERARASAEDILGAQCPDAEVLEYFDHGSYNDYEVYFSLPPAIHALTDHMPVPVREAAEPLADVDDPEVVLKNYAVDLLTHGLTQLGFKIRSTARVKLSCGGDTSAMWQKCYKSSDGNDHDLHLTIFGDGSLLFRHWNTLTDRWDSRTLECTSPSPAFSASIIRDVDAAMQRCVADSLPPDPEHAALKRVVDHYVQQRMEWLKQNVNFGGEEGDIGTEQMRFERMIQRNR